MRETDQNTLAENIDTISVPEAPLNDAARARILRMACRKAGVGQGDTPAPRTVHRRNRVKKHMRTFVIAAAAVCALSVTAFAAAPLLAKMLAGKIDFFDSAPTQSAVSDPADAPRGNYDAAAAKLEAYNAPVGQSLTNGGVTMTLDTVSMDCAGVSAFFTLTGEEAMASAVDGGDYMPTFSQFSGSEPYIHMTVNGTALHTAATMDFYRADDATLKLWVYTHLTEMPQGDAVTLTLRTDKALNVAGDWDYTVSLDGASVRQGGKTVKPDTYSFGPDTVVDLAKEFYKSELPENWPASYTKSNSLDVRYMAFGPVGGVLGVMPHTEQYDDLEVSTAMSEQLVLITDDTGRELYPVKLPAMGGASSTAVNYLGLSAPDPAAASLTITPVVMTDGGTGEWRTITTEELKNGGKFATSELGGYTVQDFQMKDGAFTFALVPYGWTMNPQISPEDDDMISYVEEKGTELNSGEEITVKKSALWSDTTDLQTGVISVRMDYYAATDEELAKITTWKYPYEGGYALDSGHAVTVPLIPAA